MRDGRSRREFLGDVGRGVLIAGVGLEAAVGLGLAPANAGAGDDPGPLRFGDREPLVGLLRDTPADRLIPVLVEKIRSGTPLRDLVAAGALANARAFGGEDYVGFHTLMALTPALFMAGESSGDRRALPVLKVLYRNTARLQAFGPSKETLRAVEPVANLPKDVSPGEALREAIRKKDVAGAEATFAAISRAGAQDAFNELLVAVEDHADVHRVVLPYRAWDLVGLVGTENAQTLLRQSVRFCVSSERNMPKDETQRVRALLPRLLERKMRLARDARPAEDGWVDHLSRAIFEGSPETAAEAAADALAEGFSPDSVGEAIALAANQLILRDSGRRKPEVQPGKPEGSVHGDSIGVHACDSANAWRNLARVANDRNARACLILGAYQVALDRVQRGGDFLDWTPRPRPEEVEGVRTVESAKLLPEAEAAIRGNDQARAAALVARIGAEGGDSRPVFDLMRTFAVSEDGALHAEKYYRTTSDEFANARPAFRWRQLVALARVTASEFGRTADGYDEACRRLGVPGA